MRRGRGVSFLTLVYVGVGVAIAASHHYFQHVHGWRGVLATADQGQKEQREQDGTKSKVQKVQRALLDL